MAVKTIAKRAPAQNAGVVKQASNKISNALLMQAAGIGVAILLVVLAVFGMKPKEIIAQCSERFEHGTLFGLQDKSGGPIATADLQARLAGRDWGLLENLKLVAVKDGPAAVAMQIGLPRITPKPDDEAQPKSGMGFTWLVPKIATARAACLTYNIWLPADFQFGGGGVLPGLFGGETADAPSAAQKGSFSIRNSWGETGAARARVVTLAQPKGIGFDLHSEGLALPRGRWVRIEQELVLNQPGADDGILRIWLDGKLQHEDLKLAVRGDDRAQLRGVVADVHFGASGQAANTVPKSTSMQVTPFELRWQ